MSEFKIEKGVPVPLKKGRNRSSKYPFKDMEIGDSFHVVGMKRGALGSRAVFYRKEHPGWDFTVRTVDGGTRIWRIA